MLKAYTRTLDKVRDTISRIGNFIVRRLHDDWVWVFTILIVTIGLSYICNAFLTELSWLQISTLNIDKKDALTYIAGVFALQIPIHIMLFEYIIKLDSLNKYILSTSNSSFRLILYTNLVLAFGVLTLPSEPTLGLGFFVFAILLLSLWTTYLYMSIVFRSDKRAKYVKKWCRKAFKREFIRRRNRNHAVARFVNSVAEKQHVETYYTTPSKDDGSHSFKAPADSIVKSLDPHRMENLMLNALRKGDIQLDNVKPESENTQPEIKKPTLLVFIRPGSKISRGQEYMRLNMLGNYRLSDSTRRSTSLIRKIDKCIHLEPDTYITKEESPLKLFKKQLEDAIKEDDKEEVAYWLVYLRLINRELLDLIEKEEDIIDRHKLSKLQDHLINKPFLVRDDDLLQQIRDIISMVCDATLQSATQGNQDVATELRKFANDELYRTGRDFSDFAAAKAEATLFLSVYKLLWEIGKPNNKRQVSAKYNETIKSTMSSILLHTEHLAHQYTYTTDTNEKQQVVKWLTLRLDNLCSVMMLSYKLSNPKMFSNTLEILSRYSNNSSRDRLLAPMDEVRAKRLCVLLMVAAHIYAKNELTSEQEECKQLLIDILKQEQATHITDALIECISNKYAKTWKIEDYDERVFGDDDSSLMQIKTYWIPNFDEKLKRLWLHLLVDQGVGAYDLHRYDNKKLAETLVFSGYSSDPEDAFMIKELEDMKKKRKKEQLEVISGVEKIVRKFINHRHDYENNLLTKQELDEKTITNFKNHINTTYKEHAFVFRLPRSTELETVKFEQKPNSNFQKLGINNLMEKQYFVKEWHVGSDMSLYANDVGKDFSLKENSYIAKKLLTCQQLHTCDDIDKWIEKLQQEQHKWLVFSIGISSWWISSTMQHIVREDKNSEAKYLKGIEQAMPIEYIDKPSELEEGLYAVALDNIGNIKVVQPETEPIEAHIDAYSHDEDLVKDILKASPAWLKDKGGADAQREYLDTKVRLLITHGTQYKPKRSRQVYYHPIKREK